MSSIAQLLTQVCTIERVTKSGALNEWGQPAEARTIIVDVPCRIETRAAKEDNPDKEGVILYGRGFFLGTADIRHEDTVVFGGRRWLVEHVSDYPGGMVSHKQVRLKEVQ